MNGDIQTITLCAHGDDIDAHVADYDRTAALVLGGCQWIEAARRADHAHQADARALGRALLDRAGR